MQPLLLMLHAGGHSLEDVRLLQSDRGPLERNPSAWPVWTGWGYVDTRVPYAPLTDLGPTFDAEADTRVQGCMTVRTQVGAERRGLCCWN